MSAFTTSMWLVVRTRSVAELGALVLLMLATTLAPGLLQAQWALGLPVVAGLIIGLKKPQLLELVDPESQFSASLGYGLANGLMAFVLHFISSAVLVAVLPAFYPHARFSPQDLIYFPIWTLGVTWLAGASRMMFESGVAALFAVGGFALAGMVLEVPFMFTFAALFRHESEASYVSALGVGANLFALGVLALASYARPWGSR